MNTTSNTTCLNCNLPMSGNAKYCENCGQPERESRLSISKLFFDLISNIFNLDGRLFKSIKHMWRPAFLAQEFIAGRRRSYVNPIRFLIVMLVILFFLLNRTVNVAPIDIGTDKALKKVERKRLAALYDSSIYLIVDPIDTISVDSLRKSIFIDIDDGSELLLPAGNIINYKFEGYEVTRDDAYSMNIDSLFKKYQLTSWKDKLIVKQILKVDKNRSQGISFIIGNLIWGIIITIFLMALLMKLLYIRSVYYYVEHLIVVVLYSAKLYAVLNILLLLQQALGESKYWNMAMTGIFILFTVYFYFTLKAYYKQGIIKTIIKMAIISFATMYIMVITMFVVLLISMAIF